MSRPLALAFVLWGAGVWAAQPVTQIHYVMGTYLRITAEGRGARAAMRDCFTEARRLDAVFSRFDPSSELTRVNARAGMPSTVSPDFARLLGRALVLGRRADGAFDVTVGPLTALWRGPTPPDDAAMASAVARVGAERISLRRMRLQLAPGTVLDFDGIAKGFAVDRCAEHLRGAGVRRALVSLGESSLVALGPWELAVRGPDAETTVGVLRLSDQAASISSTLRADTRGGRRPHIVDPRTGTARHEEAMAIVVARAATDAEAWSKALLVWGPEGRRRIEDLGAAAAVYVTPARTVPGPRAARAALYQTLARPRTLTPAEAALR
jgi:thiamine biosynthesis lipoprotein